MMATDLAATISFAAGDSDVLQVDAVQPSSKIWQYRSNGAHAKSPSWVDSKEYHHYFPRDYLKHQGVTAGQMRMIEPLINVGFMDGFRTANRMEKGMRIQTNVKKLALLLTFSTLFGCSSDEWEGFVYPNARNLSTHENIGKFDSFDSCRSSALARLSSIGSANSGTFECGLNCRVESQFGTIKICEETRD